MRNGSYEVDLAGAVVIDLNKELIDFLRRHLYALLGHCLFDLIRVDGAAAINIERVERLLEHAPLICHGISLREHASQPRRHCSSVPSESVAPSML